MRRFVDLHTHSSASDGQAPPAEVVRLAEAGRLAAVALTDHDTIDGLSAAAEAAEGLTVAFVPGVEISAEFPTGTLHVLGLGIDPSLGRLRAVLRDLRRARDRRNPRMLARLRGLGMDVTMRDLRRLAGAPTGQTRPRRRSSAGVSASGPAPSGHAVIGRLHMARLLCRKRYVRSHKEAFEKYLGHGRPAYVDKERLTPRQAIEAIRAAGGVAILAHPPQLQYPNAARLERIVKDLMDAGLDGIEVYHSDHTVAQTRLYLDLARRLGLLISGGSDFHGAAKPEGTLGRPRVPLVAVEQLLARIAR